MSPPFFQTAPSLANTYRSDRTLHEFLDRILPREVRIEIEPELIAMGAAAAGPMLDLAERAEAEEPRLITYDPWGRRIDRIDVSPAWIGLHEIQVRRVCVPFPMNRVLENTRAC